LLVNAPDPPDGARLLVWCDDRSHGVHSPSGFVPLRIMLVDLYAGLAGVSSFGELGADLSETHCARAGHNVLARCDLPSGALVKQRGAPPRPR